MFNFPGNQGGEQLDAATERGQASAPNRCQSLPPMPRQGGSGAAAAPGGQGGDGQGVKAMKSSTLAMIMAAPPTSPRPAKGCVRMGPIRLGPIRLGPIRLGPIRLGPTRLGPIRLGSIRRRSGQARGLLARPYRWDYRTADQWGRLWRMAAARRRHETPGPLGSTPIRGRRRGLEASPVPAARRSGQALSRGVQQARDRVRLTRLAKIQISHLFRHPPRHPRP